MSDVYLRRLGDAKAALRAIEAAHRCVPQNVELLCRLGRLAARSVEHYPRALEAFRAALELDPFDANTHRMLARLEGHEGRIDVASEPDKGTEFFVSVPTDRDRA